MTINGGTFFQKGESGRGNDRPHPLTGPAMIKTSNLLGDGFRSASGETAGPTPTGESMGIVERLRARPKKDAPPYAQLMLDAADEIERLREEIASCTADLAREVSEGNRYMLEAAGLREQLAEAHAETDSVVYARDQAYEQLAECRKDAERYRFIRSKGELILYNTTASQVEMENLDAAIDAAMKEKP